MRCSRSTVKWSRVSSTCVCCVLPNCCAVHVTDSIYMNYFMSTSGETLRYNMTFKPIKWFIAENWETTTKRQRYTHTHICYEHLHVILLCAFMHVKSACSRRACADWKSLVCRKDRATEREDTHTNTDTNFAHSILNQPSLAVICVLLWCTHSGSLILDENKFV